MQPRQLPLWKIVLRDCPVTIAVIAVAVAVHVGVWAYPWINPSDGSEARRRFGAYGHLIIYRGAATDESLKPIPQLVGPFDGSFRLEATAEAAGTLSALFEGMAGLMKQAAKAPRDADGRSLDR